MKLNFKNVLIVLSSMSMSKIWTIIYSRLFVFLPFQLLKLSSITWLYGQSIDLRIVYKMWMGGNQTFNLTLNILWPVFLGGDDWSNVYLSFYLWPFLADFCIFWSINFYFKLDLAQNFVKSTSKFLVGYMTIPLLNKKIQNWGLRSAYRYACPYLIVSFLLHLRSFKSISLIFY